MPLLPALFLIFLVLKLTGIIAWSWFWVTAPLWGVLVFILFYFGLFAGLGGFINSAERR